MFFCYNFASIIPPLRGPGKISPPETSQIGTPAPPPVLQEATKNSTSIWQENLEELFRNAKDWFPDVVWEVGGAEASDAMKEKEMDVRDFVEEVWGHKGRPHFFSVFFFIYFFYCIQRLCMLVHLLLFKLGISRSDNRWRCLLATIQTNQIPST